MAIWHLYVDESGDFHPHRPDHDRGPRNVAVAGLLIGDDASTRLKHARERLRRAVAPLPWPLHAAFTNKAAYHVLAHRLAAEGEPTYTVPPGVEEADRHFESMAPSRRESCLEALKSGEDPPFADLNVLEGLLHTSPFAVQAKVRNLARVPWSRVALEVSAMALATHGGLVIASETTLEDGGDDWLHTSATREKLPEGLGLDETYRYFGVLGSLIERACQVVLRTPRPEPILRLHVLSRGVHTSPGKRPMRKLTVADVETVAHRYRRVEVQVEVAEVVCYGRDASPSFVAADHVANRALAATRGSDALKVVEACLTSWFPVPVRSGYGADSRTHITSSGAARAYAGGQAVVWPATARRWAREQAEEWR